MFDSKMELLRFHFGIKKLEDWQEVLPASILSVDGVGPQTLNQIRLHLAGKGLTLETMKHQLTGNRTCSSLESVRCN